MTTYTDVKLSWDAFRSVCEQGATPAEIGKAHARFTATLHAYRVAEYNRTGHIPRLPTRGIS